MLTPKIAVATACLGAQIKQSIQAASKLEVAGIHLDLRNELKAKELSETGRRQFLHKLNELSLSVGSATFPTRGTFYDPEGIDARVSATCDALKFAAELKCRVLTLRIGRIPDDMESTEYQLLRETISDVARVGNFVGVIPCLTPAGETANAVLGFIEQIETGPVGCHFDPAICVMRQQSPVKQLRELHSVVHHVSVRDAIRDTDGGGKEVAVGRGEIDWEEFLATVNEMDYNGWLAVTRTEGDDKPGDIASAVNYLRRVMQIF